MADRTVKVTLKLGIGDYTSSIDKAAHSTDKLTASVEKTGKQHRAAWDQVGRGAAVVAGVGTAAIGAAVRSYMDFDAAMSAVGAAADSTGGQLEELRTAALRAGADTSFSATEAANAETELAKAGVSAADILGGGLKGALDLAAAGQVGVAEAAETAASAMTQFGLSGRDVPHIADLMAAAAGKAQGGVQDMSMALGQTGLVANQMGLSIEETTGTLAAFASAGLLGSDAGTSLKTALLRLAAPTGEAKAVMDDLGISAYGAGGKFVGMESIAGQLQARLGGLSAAQRNAALNTIFGADAIRAATILYTQGASGIDQWTGKVDDTGFAARQAAALTDNLRGDLERLGGSLQTALIERGSGANGALRQLTQTAGAAVDTFSGLPEPVQMVGAGLVVVSTAAGAATAGFGTLVPRVREGRQSLRDIGTAGERADRVLGRLGSTAGLAAGAFAVYEVAAVAVDRLQTAAIGAAPEVVNVQKALIGMKDAAQLGDALPNLGHDVEFLGAQVRRLADPSLGDRVRKGLTGLTGDPGKLKDAKQNIGGIDKALADMVSSGHADQAAASFEVIARKAQQQGASIDQVKEVLPGYAAALTQVGNDAKLAAEGQGKAGAAAATAKEPVSALERAARGLGVEFKETTTAAELAKTAIDKLNGVNLSALDTDIDFRESLAGVTEAIKDNGRTLDINTTKGRSNLTTISDAIKAASQHAQAVADQTGSVDKGTTVFGQHIAQLRATATAAGLPKAAVEALITQYGKVPKAVETNVSAPGAKKSTDDVKAHNTQASLVPKTKATQVAAPGAVDAAGKMTRVTQAANEIPASKTTVVAVRTADAAARVRGIVEALASLHDRTITVNVVRASMYNGMDGVLPAGGHAAGTDNAPPGWAWVGEQGPELMRFRGGEQVIDARSSAAIAARGLQPVLTSRGLQPAGDGSGPLVAEVRALRAELGQAGGRSGPLLNIERNVMQDAVGVDLLAHRVAALQGVEAGGFG